MKFAEMMDLFFVIFFEVEIIKLKFKKNYGSKKRIWIIKCQALQSFVK